MRANPANPGAGYHSLLKRIACTTIVTLACSACALVRSPVERTQALALESGFVEVALTGEPLRAYLRRSGSQTPARLTIYLESDGAPWRTPSEPPYDPTPIKPLVLQMAAADIAPAVAYLGRPCQYLSESALARCDLAQWTHGRFSEAAVSAINDAVEQIKRISGASEIALAGYSGGGAMAALVAARRSDVVCLVSVASPLDTSAWTRAIGVSPLRTSLNPAQFTASLVNIAQTHFTGNDDDAVPAAIIAAFVAPMKKVRVIARAGADHDCCWARDWRELSDQSCLSAR